MKVTLPKTPSINAIYGRRSSGGLYLKPDAVKWTDDAVLILRSFIKKKFTGDIALYVKFYAVRGDIDNIFKLLLDSLSKAGIIENDKQVTFIQIEKVKVKNPREEKVDLEIEES